MLRTTIVAAASAACLSMAIVPAANAGSIYLIGNSLTYDLSVWGLGSPVAYHIDCNKNLQYIHDHPEAPCIAGGNWPTQLAAASYDWLSVQPFFGTTIEQDTAVISEWMDMQPTATVVIHTGWTYSASFEETYHSGWDGVNMTHCPEYFAALREALLELHPGRTIVINDAIGTIDRIYHDIQAGIAPYEDLSELYRDQIHMDYGDGYFLARATMRHTLGFATPGNPPVDPVSPEHQTYLEAVIVNCPADVNRDGVGDIADLLTYLDEWFAGIPNAERGADDGAVDVFDLLAFLDDWFAGC